MLYIFNIYGLSLKFYFLLLNYIKRENFFFLEKVIRKFLFIKEIIMGYLNFVLFF